MAKVDLNKLQEDRADRAAWGAVLHRVPGLLYLTDSEFAGRIGVSHQQLSNWFAGTENAAMWRFYRDPDVRDALLLAQAKAAQKPVTFAVGL